MMRLIDADGLKKSIEEDEELKSNSLVYLLMNLMTCYIDDSITIDAEPVRHGHWVSEYHRSYTYNNQLIEPGGFLPIGDDGSPIGACRCSVCGEYLIASDEYDVLGYYCPNCGAKMDEEVTT